MTIKPILLATALAIAFLLTAPMAVTADMPAYRAAASDLEQSLDRTSWSLEAFSLAMAVEDLDTIAERLRAHFSTQIYAGVLRGADGAFAARSGNAYDQALAAIRVLNEAGYLTRIARSELDDANLDALLRNVRAPVFGSGVANRASMQQAMTALGQSSGAPDLFTPVQSTLRDGWPELPIIDDVATVSARLLDSAGETTLPAATDALRRQASDYVWIQARKSAADDWQDLHLAFTPVNKVQANDFLDSPVPESLLHRLRIKFLVETREGERFTQHRLMPDQSFPVANLGRRPLTFSILPDALMNNNVGVDLSESSYYYPLFGDGMAPSANAFTAEGFVVEAAVIAEGGGIAEVFATIGRQGTAATDALAAISATDDTDEAPATVREATGVLLEVRYEPPGEQAPLVFSRYVIDRIGPERRAQGAITEKDNPPEFAGRWSLHAITGDISPAEMLEAQIKRLPYAGKEDTPAPLSNPGETAALANLFHRVAESGGGPESVSYRYRPFIAITGVQILDDVRQSHSIDILQTGARSLDGQGRPAWKAALAGGVFESLLEASLMDASAPPGTRVQQVGAWQVLREAKQLQWVRSQDQVDEIDLPLHSANALKTEIGLGYWAAVAPGDTPAWWRIDPTTGAAIGVNQYGQGGEMAEYLTILDYVVTAGLYLYGSYKCGADSTTAAQAACCQATNVAWTIIGAGGLAAGGKWLVGRGIADEYMAALLGFALGTSSGLAGVNPLDSLLCPPRN